jgi:branched-chain amino acid transport system substrate-binding protein
MRRRSLLAAVPALAVPSVVRANDEEIRIGNIMPYSGPASPLSEVGKVEAAYIKMLNENGGINKRRLNFITLDDGLQPTQGRRARAAAR